MRFFIVFLTSFALAATAAAQSGDASLSALEARKLLSDKNPQARLRGALVLTAHRDAQGIEALIALLEELPATDCRQAEQALGELAGDWSPNPPLPGDDEVSRKIRREVWASWWRTIDGPMLLNAFRQQTLSDKEAAAITTLLEQLDDKSAAVREKARAALKEMGPKAAGLLRSIQGRDSEHQRAIDRCLQEIAPSERGGRFPLAAPGLLAARKPDGAAAALLAYLPHANDRLMNDEILKALKTLVVASAKPDSAILQALKDPLPLRRAVAAEALVGAAGATQWSVVRPLLKDADMQVRLRVALALVMAQDREAVPALISLLAELPRPQALEAEDLLQRLAGSKAPVVPLGQDDAAARKKLAAAWQAWWSEHGAAVNLAEFAKTTGSSGLTVIAFGDGKKAGFGAAGGPGKLLAVDRSGQVRWQIDNLDHPSDVRLLPGNRVLIAEYSGRRVTERDTKGNILWQVNLPANPVNVQRLANGNTFIACYGTPAKAGGQAMLEVDPTGKIVANFPAPGAGANPGAAIGLARDMIFAAQKLPDGKMVCLTYDQNCVWMDATGKEIKRVAVPQTKGSSPLNTVGNIDLTPKGTVLFAHMGGTIAEYDADGKAVWQAKASGHRATKLANGNTLVVLTNGGVIEMDATGRTLWQFNPPNGLQAIRARQ